MIKIFAFSEKLTCTKDFGNRQILNLLEKLKPLKSLIYIRKNGDKEDKNVKTEIGLRSLNLKKGDIYKIITSYPSPIQFEEQENKQEEADRDKVIEIMKNI